MALTELKGYQRLLMEGLGQIKLKNSSVAIDLTNTTLLDASAVEALDWESRVLKNSSGNAALTWASTAMVASVNLDMNANKVTNLGAPTADADAATKLYVDDAIAAIPSVDLTDYFKKDGTVTATGNFNLGTFKVTNLGAPTADADAATKEYVDDAVANYVPLASKDQANGVAGLDANGKLAEAVIPAIAITDTFVVADEAAMLALTAETGDVAIREDESKSYILQGADPSVLANWKWLKTPAAPVMSVNGQTGTVTLDSDDIAEGTTNLYFTVAAARAAAVVDSTAGDETDQAASVSAMKDYVAAEIAAIPAVDLSDYLKKDGSVNLEGNLLPSVTETYNLGSSSSQFSGIYSFGFDAKGDGSYFQVADASSYMYMARETDGGNGTKYQLAMSNGSLLIKTSGTDDLASTLSPKIVMATGVGTDNSGALQFSTGNANNGYSGNIVLTTGTATTTRGSVVVDASLLDMSSKKIINIAAPTTDNDAATKKYVDDEIAALPASANTALSNLTTTSINQPLLPDANATRDLGSDSLRWATVRGSSILGNNFQTHPTVTVTGDIASGSPTISNMSSTSGFVLGVEVIAAGVPQGTFVTAIVDSTTVTMSANATATTTGLTIYLANTLLARSINTSGSVPSASAVVRSGNTSAGASGFATLKSGNTGAGASGAVLVISGNSTSGGDTGSAGLLSGDTSANTGAVLVKSGDSSAGGTTGDLTLATGSTSGTRGVVRLSAPAMDMLSAAKIINLVDPTANQDAATKKYVDDAIAGIPSVDLSAYLKKDGTVAYDNDTAFKIRNFANDADVDVFKLSADDNFTLLTNIYPASGTYFGDSTTYKSLDIDVRAAYASTEDIAIDWENRLLKLNDLTTTVDWAVGMLTDPTGNQSIDWGTRKIYDEVEDDVLSWSATSVNFSKSITANSDATLDIGAVTEAFANLYANSVLSGDVDYMLLGTTQGTSTAELYLSTVLDATTTVSDTGTIYILPNYAGLASDVNGGAVYVNTNDTNGTGNSGLVQLKSGNAVDGVSGPVNIYTGDSANSDSGNISIVTGLAANGVRGGIILEGSTISASSAKITNLGTPTADQDAATKKYVDDEIAAIPSVDLTDYFKKDGTVPFNNNAMFTARNAANTANVDLFKLDASDKFTLQTDLFASVDDTLKIGAATEAFANVYANNLWSGNTDMMRVGTDAGTGYAELTIGTGLLSETTLNEAGSIFIQPNVSGVAEDMNGGFVYMATANGTGTSNTGKLEFVTGNAAGTGASGEIRITTGQANSGSSGSIYLSTGSSSGTRGDVIFSAAKVVAGNARITDVGAPTDANDAATKKYVDWKEYEVDFQSLSGAADDKLVFALPANTIVEGIFIKSTTAFAGSGIVDVTAKIGIAGDIAKFASAYNVSNTVAGGNYQLTQVLKGPEDWNAGEDVLVTFEAASGDLANLSSGVVRIAVKLGKLSFG